jgi:hypothetical protein
MKNLIKQLNRAGESLVNAVNIARFQAEEQALDLIAEEIHKRGYETESVEKYFDFARQQLETNPTEGLLVNEVLIAGEKSTKKVIAAYRLEVSYKPEGFNDQQAIVMKIRGRVQEVTESFLYPEDDESLFN